MATVTRTIGTSGRDYSTIAAWEADLDNAGVYTAGDDAVGACYDDSTFDERVTIDGGGSVGLATIKLTAPESERHDGTAASGVRIVRSGAAGGTLRYISLRSGEISWLEVDANQNDTVGGAVVNASNNNSDTVLLHHLLVHGVYGLSAEAQGGVELLNCADGSSIHNCIVYDIRRDYPAGSGNVFGISPHSSPQTGSCYNDTVHNCREEHASSAGDAFGISLADLTGIGVRNCIATDTMNAGSGDAADYQVSSPTNATLDHNLSSDATASGAGSLTGKAAADQFVSTASGSEDLHLLGGADAVDAGADLGTTPTGIEIDVDGRDRDAQADVWDMGADEYANEAQAGQPTMRRWGGVPGMRTSPMFGRSW